MSASNGNNGDGDGGAPSVPAGTVRAVPDTIDFVYDNATSGNVAANAEVRQNDWTDIVGEHQTRTNEILEVERMEMEVPRTYDTNGNPTGLETFQHLRLWDGQAYYPHVRYREFMQSLFSELDQMRPPRLGVPVLSGAKNPEQDPINTATPKFGPSTTVSPAIQNDGTAITDSFRVRLYVWRWEGTQRELQGYLNALYGRASFNQSIRMSNPYTGNSRTYSRDSTVQLSGNNALGNFERLTGGTDQSMPRVYPWVTWATNNQATRQNQFYQFTTRNDRVAETWQSLEFDYTEERNAAIFENAQITEQPNLYEMEVVNEERQTNPSLSLGTGIEHELPLVRNLDGTRRQLHDTGQLPRGFGTRLGGKQVVWDDGGGLRVRDDGDASIPAGDLLLGVNGKRLELTS